MRSQNVLPASATTNNQIRAYAALRALNVLHGPAPHFAPAAPHVPKPRQRVPQLPTPQAMRWVNEFIRLSAPPPPPPPPLQRRRGVYGGRPQNASMTTNGNNNGENVTSRRRQAPVERQNSSKPPPPGGNNAAGAVRVSPVEERQIQRNVAKQVAQMAPLQSQRWWTANEVRPGPVYTPIVSRGPTANQIIEQLESNAFYARLAAEIEAKRLKAEERRQAVKRVAGAAKTAALAGGRALISGISASGRAATAGALAAGMATKAGALAAGRLTKAGALAASETAKRLVNMEMAWSEERQRRAEEAAARAAVEKAAKNKAAAEAAAKKAANAKAAAAEALKKATANKTARRAGLIWRAKARKLAANKAMIEAAKWLNEQNKRAEEANKLQRTAERATNNTKFQTMVANLAAAKSSFTRTESQKVRQAANAASRAEFAAASKALREIEKTNLNAALKRAIANGNVEAIERMRTSALFRETPAGPGRPLFKRSNKQEKVFQNALIKAKKVAAAKRAGNIARQGEAKRFAEKAAASNALRQAGAAANRARQVAVNKAANNARQAKELQNYIEAIRKGAAARKAKKTEESAVYVQTGGSSRGVVKTPIRSLTPRK